ncbi:MAG: FAD-dependent oxidoreductase [Deltaproteobacteria bacterium]|nr:FAD-dependent oxidoreductase [Deltaproteobacteria bacterium]
MAEATQIKLTIDGRPLTALAGQSVLDVARQNGIEIPTLCHDPRLPPYGSCLLCCVEVAGARKLLLACATEARDGMVVQTHSERVVQARTQILDLLLSNHFADCRGPCYDACPAHVDVQGYLALANQGKYLAALELIRETNPLPSVCGRVCVRYCEKACRRQQVDSAVGINLIKRYLSDLESGHLPRPQPTPRNGQRVAVVGGGPGGLTAAYFLAKRGYDVEILEARPKLGGTLRYGIPDYRLPQAVLDAEIQYILDHGVSAQCGVRLGTDFSLDDLKRQGFGAIFLALGAMKAKPMGVEGERTEGVLGGIDFLTAIKLQGPPELKGIVLTVGGGNTAIDAARSALRCGAARSVILYRRTRDEMPADAGEIEDALAEGVQIEFLVAPMKVVVENGRVKALRCQRMRLGEPDASGRRRPVPIPGSEQEYTCNTIIAAIGQDVVLDGTAGNQLGDLKASRWGTLTVDSHTFATNLPGVFAAGDVVSGPAAAVDAIGGGRLAALAIDTYLQTGKVVGQPEFVSKRTELGEIPQDYFDRFAKTTRAETHKMLPEESVRTWAEMDRGITAEQVKPETDRCLSCGCSEVFTCQLKRWADQYQVQQKRLAGKVKKYKPDLRHPLIALDPNKCILCGRCVRLCGELLKVSALGFVHRGFETMVRPSLERPLQETTCISCGNCIETCPTGAISARLPFERPGPWRLTPHESLCGFCGVGCNIVYNKKDDYIWTVTAKPRSPDILGDLCVRGRFGHRLNVEARRIVEPRFRDGAGQRPTTLDSALERAASGLRGVAEHHGAGALAVLVSPKATNEEIELCQRLARQALGIDNVASLELLARRWEPTDLAPSLGLTASTLPLEQVESAQLVVVVNADVTEENPVHGFHIKRAVRKGAELFCISAVETAITEFATLRLDARRGTSTALLDAVAAEVIRRKGLDTDYIGARTEGFDAYARALPTDLAAIENTTGVERHKIEALAQALCDRGKRAVFVYDDDSAQDRAPGDLQSIANLLLLTGRLGQPGQGLVIARHHSNGQGLLDLGALPGAVAGGKPLAGCRTLAELWQAIEGGRIRGLLVVGEDVAADARCAGLLAQAEHIVVVDVFETPTAAAAHVVLPGSAYAESTGSATAMDREVQAFTPVFAPPAGATGFEVLARLYAALAKVNAPTIEQVRSDIGKRVARYAPIASIRPGAPFYWSEGAQPAEALFATRFATASGRARFIAAATAPAQTYPRPKTVFSTLDVLFAQRQRRMFPRPAL